VATPVVQAVRHVRQQPVIHVDETGWRQRRQRAWLQRNIVDYVTQACVAALHGVPAPSLLPAPSRNPVSA